MAYHRFKTEVGEEYGCFETFFMTAGDIEDSGWLEDDDEPISSLEKAGWYWWACFPGCLPDGEPRGPFKTERDAINDALEV